MRRPIDALLLVWDDNANSVYRYWRCLLNLGLNAVAFKGRPHSFGYPEQVPIHPSLASRPLQMSPTTVMAPGLETLIESSHVVHLFASTWPVVALGWERNVVVQHGGSVYRANPEASNKIFNKIARHTIVQCPDLLGLGAKNETLIHYPVDTKLIQPDFSRKGDKLKVGHWPSNPKVKGTGAVLKAVSGVDIDFIGAEQPGLLPWPKHLERLKKCDVYIEACNPEIDGKKYGEWGNAALEAAASGCIVITHSLHENIYREEYGELGVHVANDVETLNGKLQWLAGLSEAEITRLKEASRAWAEAHNFEATGQRLWDKVYKDFF